MTDELSLKMLSDLPEVSHRNSHFSSVPVLALSLEDSLCPLFLTEEQGMPLSFHVVWENAYGL